MRNLVLAASGAALAISAWAVCGQASAFETVIGGFAGGCSAAAKEGHSDQKSLDLCNRALSGEMLDTHDRAGTYVNRGAMEILNQDYEAANNDFGEALRIMPSMGEAHIGRGVYLISMARFADAEPEIDRGLQLGSEEREKGYYFRGIARWGQENFKGAYYDFQKAIELKPGWSLPKEQLTKFKVAPAG